ncbi:triose-phosphate transporter family-domain-containing protein [Microdochium trichocladiopsis]|uniref:Triose-phosphate transporter family-domain-containing protein n=1 Tax=Microdochium trichocladiopsis TaxID=1682393 RepID=A0A9P9BS08_9PEZI|nr:triose-phosphate transporter family-domain-containing protein [Microdochium trichocladiopsis]KAH7033370.1 triose-phosphate transporter family-domain-containing protein [Microdochium trichocladiopsis]
MGPTSLALAHPALFVLSWVFFSNLTILFNKWLIDAAGFPYPVILTCWHMVFATAATQTLARTTRVLDSRHAVQMTRHTYLRAVVPIGVMYSVSMVCSTLVYLYLSVPFIQMLKAAAPAVVLFVGWIWGVESPTPKTILNIAGIIVGVIVASAGEIHFSWTGFLYQLGGLVFESLRVIMIQALFTKNQGTNSAPEESNDCPSTTSLASEGKDEEKPAMRGATQINETQLRKMDPLVGLYYYAPVCAATNFILSIVWEGGSFHWQHVIDVGPITLLLNALVAFLLNVSSVLLIGKTSGLVLVLTGILKNILLVAFAVVFTGERITISQALGYATALLGLVIYQAGWHDLRRLAAAGMPSSTSIASIRILWRRRVNRRIVAVGGIACLAATCLVFAWQHNQQQQQPPLPVSAQTLPLMHWMSSLVPWFGLESSDPVSGLPSTPAKDRGGTPPTAWLPTWLLGRPAADPAG